MMNGPGRRIDGDTCVALLGHSFDAPDVRAAFAALDIPWRPQVSDQRPLDWIRAGGLELGFEDQGVFHAREKPEPSAPPVLQQVCFYAPRAGGAPLPVALPFGLSEDTTRDGARRMLAPHGRAMRSGVRDAFDIHGIAHPVTIVLGYREADRLDSVLALVPQDPRAPSTRGPRGFGEVAALFGLDWHHQALFDLLYSASKDRDAALPQIKRHGTFDLVRERGLRLLFERAGARWTLAGCEIYRGRVRDAATWQGELPFGICFEDSPADVSARLRRQPDRVVPGSLQSSYAWTLPEIHVVVIYDQVLNLVASVIIGTKSYFETGVD